jgi:hypothetical protein
MKSIKRFLIPGLLMLVAICLLIFGLRNGQFLETLNNGAQLCLSCIGIQ